MLTFHKKSAALLALMGILIPVGTASAGPIELTATSQMMETHPTIANGVLPFYKEWEKRSNGEVRVTFFNPGTLCPVPDNFNVGRKGAIDIVQNGASSAPAMFPLIMAMEMPMMFNNARTAVFSSLTMVEENALLQNEFKEWKILNIGASAPRQLLSIRKPILSMEDVKGLKVAVTNPQNGESITALGGVPVVLPLNDIYLALQRGLVDAATLPVPTFRSTKVTEVAKHITIVNLAPAPTAILMNRERYESLPPHAKAELDKMAGMPFGALNSHFVEYYAVEDLAWVVKNHKVKVYELSEAEHERWGKAMEPVHTVWIEKTKKQGIENPQAFLDQLKEISTRFDEEQELWDALQTQKEAMGDLFPPEDILKVLYPEQMTSAQ